jgi:cleavage stimulation factor subunit 2
MINERHDVFVGNLTFNTTDEQLHEIFSFVGPIKAIRILYDKELGRPKGFAFIEYNDANTALAAIRRLDGTEMNGRKLKVSYSNNSNLRDVARSIGLDVSENDALQRHEEKVVTGLHLHEAWDVLDFVKRLADEGTGAKARQLLEKYPQLIPALLQIEVRLLI